MTGREGPRPGSREGAELDEEIRHHVLERADLLIEQGWSREDAMREAARRFGDAERVRREMHRARAGGLAARLADAIGFVGRDLRYALRAIRKAPGFSAALIATLALGIGSAAAIFSVVDALLLRPLPYRDAERLVEVNLEALQRRGYTPGMTTSRVPGWRAAGSEIADAWIAWSLGTLTRVDGSFPEELDIVALTPGVDTLLDIPLLVGRGLTSEDARPGSPDVGVLGRGFYERLGGTPDLLGETIRLESGPVTIVGVLRGGVRFPTWGGERDLWIPMREDFTAADRPVPFVAGFWMRLRPGLTLEAARQRAVALAAGLQEREPLDDGWQVRLEPVGARRASEGLRTALVTLSLTVAALLLIASLNSVNLVLLRASGRARELAVRRSIGGSRRHVLGQLLTEGLTFGVLGGVAALAFAALATAALRGALPWVVAWSSPHPIEIEGRTLVFTFASALLVGALLGLVPGLRTAGGPGLAALTRAGDDSADRRSLRRALVVLQVAVSMTLLVAAGLFVNGFARLMATDPGYDVDQVAHAQISLSLSRYPDPAARAEFFRRLEASLVAHPAIAAVSRAEGLGFRSGVRLEPEGGIAPDEQPVRVPSVEIAPDYLETTGTRLIAGRAFGAGDVGGDAVIVDRDLAEFLWDGDAVGRRFRMAEGEPWLRVVGVVEELRLMGRDQREGPYQILHPASPDSVDRWVRLAIRSDGDPAAVLGVVRRAVRDLDPEQTIWRLQTAAESLAEHEAELRFLVELMGLLAGIAVALAAVGLYGVLAGSVARRRRELAVRMAVGAEAGMLRGMVLTEGLRLASAGVLLGILGALLATRAFETLLYEVPPGDPPTLGGAAAVLLLIAAAASWVPARRATRVDPAETLRRD